MKGPRRHRGETRPCPVPMCGATAKAGQLMCRPCWGNVPRRLQADVSRTWRAYRSKLAARAIPDARLEARKAYIIASDAAVDAATASRP